jgi:segregation and condensation protein B
LERIDALKAIEVVLFVSDTPVTVENLRAVLEGFNKDEVRELVAELTTKYEDRGIHVVEIAEGYQLRTKPECGDWVKKFHKLTKSTKLSQAALETLSMIAYRQPITRQEIEDIRGVDSSGVLKNLLDKNLIKSLGRKKVPGKPVTFGTTKKFLEYFGLVKLSDLPTLRDFPADDSGGAQEALRFDEMTQTAMEDLEPMEEGEGAFDAPVKDDEIEQEEPPIEPTDGDDIEEKEKDDEEDGENQASENTR